MQDAAPKDRQHGKHPFEHGTLTSGEDGNVAGCGAMASARHRTIDRLGASGRDLGSEARHLGLVGGAHLGPDLAGTKPGKNAVIGFHHSRAGGRRRQACDDDVTSLGHRLRAVAPGGASVDERLCHIRVEVAHRQLDPIAKKTAGKLAADISKTDETDTDHQTVPQVISVIAS